MDGSPSLSHRRPVHTTAHRRAATTGSGNAAASASRGRLRPPAYLLTLRQVGEQLGLADPRSVQRLLQAHDLPLYRLGRSLRVDPDDLTAALRAAVVLPAPRRPSSASPKEPVVTAAKPTRPKKRTGFKQRLDTNWWREHRVDCPASLDRTLGVQVACRCPTYWRETIEAGLRRTHGPDCAAARTRQRPPRPCGCPFNADVPDEHGRKRVKAATLTEAKAELARRRALPPATAPPASTSMTVSMFFDDHLVADFGLAERTTWLYKRDFDLFHRDAIGDLALDEVTSPALQMHANGLLAACSARRSRTNKYVPDAISAMWTPVRSIFKHAIASGRLVDAPNPTAGVVLPKAPPPAPGERMTRRGGNVVAREEFVRLRAWLDGRGRGVDWGVALQAAFEHALRPGEIRGLRVGDVDLANRLLRIVTQVTETSERKRPKHVAPHAEVTLQPLSEGMAARFAAWLDQHPGRHDPDACLFWYRSVDQPLTHMAFHHALHRAQDATGVRAVDGLKLTPHGLRHSGLTYLGASGASALNLQLHGRHASIQMTDKYLHMTSVEALRHLADMHDRASVYRSFQPRPATSWPGRASGSSFGVRGSPSCSRVAPGCSPAGQNPRGGSASSGSRPMSATGPRLSCCSWAASRKSPRSSNAGSPNISPRDNSSPSSFSQ